MRGATALFVLCPLFALPSSGQPHSMARRTLFTARADSEQVAPRVQVRSDASATGAFIISADAKSVSWRLTWDGLRSEKVDTIDLHDFGWGAVGKSVTTLCSYATTPCPQASAGTIEGTWAIPPALTRELGVERIYVDVHTSAAKDGEIRGQVLPLPWMVHSDQFIAKMKNGTATLYITPFPRGTQLQFDVTVAGLPAAEAVVAISRGGRRIATFSVDGKSVRRRGGTISAIVQGPPISADLLSAIHAGNATIAVVSKNKTVSSGTLVPVM